MYMRPPLQELHLSPLILPVVLAQELPLSSTCPKPPAQVSSRSPVSSAPISWLPKWVAFDVKGLVFP